MKKKFTKYTRKALSALMALIMVFSMFVFSPEMFKKAEAATAGKYYYKVVLEVTDDFDNLQLKWSLSGVTNNGKGSETSITSGGWTSDKDTDSNTNYTLMEGTSNNGVFPTKVIIRDNDGAKYHFGRSLESKVHLYVGSSSTSLTEMYLNGTSSGVSNATISVGSGKGAKFNWTAKYNVVTGTSNKFTCTYTVNNSTSAGDKVNYYPAVNSITWSAETAKSITVPTGSTAATAETGTATAKDQYGVNWYADPSYALSESSAVTTKTTTITGVSTTGGSYCTVSVSNSAKEWASGNKNGSTYQKNVYVTAYIGSVTTARSIKFTITNCKYTITPNPNGNGDAFLADGTKDVTNYYGFKYAIEPSAVRTGYTLLGFYLTQYDISYDDILPTAPLKLNSNTVIEGNQTWYAAWQANKYPVTFYAKNETSDKVFVSSSDVYYGKTPEAPGSQPNYSRGDYDYKFTGWPTIKPMTETGAEYTANYSEKFIPADYTELEAKIAEARAIINDTNVNYTQEYTESSRNVFEAALNNAITYDEEDHKGRTQQETVDSYTNALQSAIKNLGRAQYSVVYINRITNNYLKVDYPVYNKSVLQFPANPENFADGINGHYVFTGWEAASEDYNLSSVTTNMVIFANYELQPHTFDVEEYPSSCTSIDRKVYTCSDCGYSYEESSGTTGDHVWKTEWTEDVPATCTTAGSKSIHCEVCGAKKNITELPALGHDYSGVSWSTILESKCGQQGIEVRKCKVCGFNEYNIISAGSHEYTSVVTEPTCTSNGYTTDTCSKCGDVVIKDFTPLKAHTYTEDTSKTVEATCTNNGIKYSYCTCGAEKVETTPALSHTWGEATTDFAATCENAGQKSVKCAVCGVVDEDSIEVITALDHDYAAEWSVLVPATCTGKGTKVKECSRCNAKLVEEIPALTHNFNTEAEVLVEATCGTNSVKKYACANNCGEYIIEVGTENYTHTYGEWVVTDATCTAEGSKTRTCSRCGNVDTDVVSMTAHSYTDTTPIAATCTMPAGTTYKCATCDSTYTVYSGDANGHDLSYTVDGGKVTISCANCDFEETFDAELPVDGGHNWTKISETAATCKAEGEIVFGCTDDGCTVENVTVTVPVNEEAHDISTVVTEAGCETAGKVVTSCSRCDFSEEIALAAKGHTFTFPGTVTKAATCSEDGIITFECADCDKTETQTVPAIGHTYEATAETAEATCSAPAYTVYKCSTCDAKVNVTTGNADPTKHNFVVTTEVSGNATTVTVECSLCGAKKTEDIDAPHHYTSAEIITPSACNVEGLVRVYCGDTDCDYYIDINLPTTDHNFVAAYTAPTCSLDGSIRFFCSACGAEDEASAQVLPAIGHTWGTTVTDHKDATCTEDGYDEYTCVRCTETHKETIAKTGHTWLENTDRYEAPTCTADGKKVYECSSCDAEVEIAVSFDANTIHSYEVTSVPATCATAGYDKYVCAACGDVIYKNIVPATNNHTFVISEIEATCTSKSGKHFECSGCSLSYDVLDGEYAPHPWAEEWTIEKEATCTEFGEKAIYCTACGERGVSALIAKLGHSVDEVTPVDINAGDGFMWYTYDCSRCHDYKSVKLDVIAKSTSGAVIKDARFVLYNSNGDMVSKGVAEGDGRYYTEKSLLRPGAYVLTIFADDAHYSISALVVSPDGNVSGSITGVELSTCGHICHGDNFIAKIIRSICTFFSAKFNRTIKCCDDMEWYGKYADQIKH